MCCEVHKHYVKIKYMTKVAHRLGEENKSKRWKVLILHISGIISLADRLWQVKDVY